MSAAAYSTLRHLPDGADRVPLRRPTLGDILKSMIRNKPFALLTTINVLLGMGAGMWVTLSYVIYDYYYRLGRALPTTYIIGYAVTAVSLPLFEKVCYFKGKKQAFALLQLLFLALITLPACVQPGNQAYIPLCLALVGVQAVMICSFTISNAILIDVIEYGRWKHGFGHTGSYFAVSAMLSGIASSIGGSVGLFVLGHLGFSPEGITNLHDAQTAVRITFYGTPIVLTVLATIAIWQLPISAHQSAIIRRRLNARQGGQTAVKMVSDL